MNYILSNAFIFHYFQIASDKEAEVLAASRKLLELNENVKAKSKEMDVKLNELATNQKRLEEEVRTLRI